MKHPRPESASPYESPAHQRALARRARLRRRLPVTLDGRIVYEPFANAVKGQVR